MVEKAGSRRPSGEPREPIAIVGMAGRFPGADHIDEFWQNLLGGLESITFFSDDELRDAGVKESTLHDPNYVRAAPIIADHDRFDADYFGVNARESQLLDPQFRVFLEICDTALGHAGLVPYDFDGRIGVYAGSAPNSYLGDNVLRNAALVRMTGTLQAVIYNHTDYLATSAAFRLGLTGPAMSIVTACSTALVAVHTAVRALRGRECEAAVAGGVELALPMVSGYGYVPGAMFSPDGHVRAFDAKAQGTVFGSGVGAVVLKRLSDAMADRDTIHAVIRGSAINNDGSDKIAFVAPSRSGQVAVVRAALRDAGVDPAEIGNVEAHGTGTAIGDPIEVGALSAAFGKRPEYADRCAISSVKSNVGHLGAAAGVAGLIKAVYSVREGLLPPAINFDDPNPGIDFENGPFRVPTTVTTWGSDSRPRLSTVSAFGVGGTNAHIVVEQAPAPIPSMPSDRPYQLLTLSARSSAAFADAARRLGGHIAGEQAELADVAYTLTRGRKAMPMRGFVVAADEQEAVHTLSGLSTPVAESSAHDRTVTFLFPGQGTQYPGMSRDLYTTESVFRETIDYCATALRDSHGLDLIALLFGSDAKEAAARLARTEYAQPALFAVEYALAQLLLSRGVRPTAMAGHSVGEFVAAVIAGVFDLDDALALVAERGVLMQSLPVGAMAAVLAPERLVAPMLDDAVDIAAVNAPGICVISGPLEAVSQATEALTVAGMTVRPLHTSHAFHSRMMNPILGTFRERVAEVALSAPNIPYVSNVTGTWITEAQATDPEYWVRQLRDRVLFSDTLRLLTADDRVLVEVGPGHTLSGLVTAHRKDAVTVTTLRDANQTRDDTRSLLDAIGQVWAVGAPVDWDTFWAAEQRSSIPLPAYPYQRERHWVDPDPKDEAAITEQNTGPLTVPVWRETAPPEAGPLDQEPSWVVFASADPTIRELVRLANDAGIDVLVAGPDDDQDQLFRRLAERGPDQVRIVHALAAATRPTDVGEAEYVRHWLDVGFDSALTALQTVARLLPGTAVDYVIVTRDMQNVTGDGQIEPAKAAMLGLVKLAPKEFADLTARSVDLGTSSHQVMMPGTEARNLLAEITGALADEQVAYRGRKRWVWGFEELRLSSPDGVPAVLTERGVYVITGGLGGLGLLLAEQLAGLVSARLVLVGRTPLPHRDEWPKILAAAGQNDQDDVVASRLRGVLCAEAAGGEVLVTVGDVTDEVDMMSVKRRAEDHFGSVDGVFHLAAVAGGGMLETRALSDAAQVLGPKVAGTYVLERVFDPALFVLYSSISAISGDFGLGDYVGANAVLDAFAQSRWARGRHTIAINWPGFAETGMASRIDSPMILGSLRHETDTQVSHPLMRSRRSLPDGTISFELNLDPTHWVFDQHRLADSPTMPGTGMVEIIRAAFAELTGESDVEVSKLIFLSPLMLADDLTARVNLTSDPSLDTPAYDVKFVGGDGVEYARARVRAAPDAPAAECDLERLGAECTVVETNPEFTGQLADLRLGPRWGLAGYQSAGSLELVEVRLPDEYTADLAEFYLHPAVLDMCTAGQRLAGDGLYLPFGYDKITTFGRLPASVIGIARHRDDTTGDLTTVDIDVVDPSGRVLVTIEGYSLVRVEAVQRQLATTVETSKRLATPIEPPAEYLSDTVSNAEGARMLRLVLASGFGPQIIYAPEGLAERLRRAARVTRSAVSGRLADATSGPTSEARTLATPYIEPAGEVEQALASLWGEALGVDPIGAEDDFFDLGGNSLVAVQLVAHVTQRFRVDISVADVFDARNLRLLAIALDERLLAKVEGLSDEEASAAVERIEEE